MFASGMESQEDLSNCFFSSDGSVNFRFDECGTTASRQADSMVYQTVVKQEIDGVRTSILDTDDNELYIECSKSVSDFNTFPADVVESFDLRLDVGIVVGGEFRAHGRGSEPVDL